MKEFEKAKDQIEGNYSIPIEAVKEEPVGGTFHSVDRESLNEGRREPLTVFMVPLVALNAIFIFSVWWRKRE